MISAKGKDFKAKGSIKDIMMEFAGICVCLAESLEESEKNVDAAKGSAVLAVTTALLAAMDKDSTGILERAFGLLASAKENEWGEETEEFFRELKEDLVHMCDGEEGGVES